MRKAILAVALIAYGMLALGSAVRSADTPKPGSAAPATPPPAQAPPGTVAPGQAPPPGGPPPGMMPPGGRPMGPPPITAGVDSFQAERDSLVNEMLQKISGKENVAAESVFKNIKVFKGFPAGRLMRVMNGWGHALGTQCQHCHVVNHWADEDKKPKQIARDMTFFVGAINDSLLPKIQNLHSEHPHVGCMTCHRGRVLPG